MRNCSAGPDAVAYMQGGEEAPRLSGSIQFYQKCGSVLVVANVAGLPQNSNTGFFPLHIHGGGSCSGEGFPHTGGHYNPAGAPHPGHAGDLPPLLLCRGRAYLAVRTDRFSVQDIIGRSVVIHSGSDDFKSQPAGGSGTKIACGIIRRP